MVALTRLAVAAVVLSLAAASGLRWSQRQLRLKPRARQLLSGDWIENSPSKNDTRIRIMNATPERLDIQYQVLH